MKKCKILIVEDNRINQLLVKNALKNFGFVDFDSAENSTDAFRKLSESDYDIILMDIQMPGMDGYEITREIRSGMREPICNIPIIALTADSSAKEKEKAKAAGMNDYVIKPYSPEDLYLIMLKYLDPAVKQDINRKAKKTGKKNPLNQPAKTAGMELEFLEKYTGGDVSITIQLVELFLREVPEAIQKLEVLTREEKWKEVHAIAHKVKSCIAIFELMELKSCILRIEECAGETSCTDEIPALFSEFKKGSLAVSKDLEMQLKMLKHEKTDQDSPR